jgi:hypothetical protein
MAETRAPVRHVRSGSVCRPPDTDGRVGRPARGLQDPFASRVGWLPVAFSAGIRPVRIRPIDAGCSTSLPVTADAVAGIVAREDRVPWSASPSSALDCR